MRFHMLRIFGDLNVAAAALNLALHDAAVAADRRARRRTQHDGRSHRVREIANVRMTAREPP
jgi:hypothetical protein